MMDLINVGFNNLIPVTKISMVAETGSSAMKRIIKRAKEEEKLINATCGRAAKSIVLLENGFVVISALAALTIGSRISNSTPFGNTESKRSG
mgnify:CR=1 FL=1